MNHFVMADGQHVIFRIRIRHTERELILVVLAIYGVLCEVLQGVIHPAQVPLVTESQATSVDRLRHTGERRGFLGYDRNRFVGTVRGGVGPLKEIDGLVIFASAVAVRHPLVILARIVQVNHRRDGVDA